MNSSKLLLLTFLAFGLNCNVFALNLIKTTQIQMFAVQPADEDTSMIYTKVEEIPTYPGGDSAMMNFIAKNLNYPAEALTKEVEGKVFVKFVVETDGSLTDVKVIRGIGYGCDEEAIRVLKLMPKWKPGKQFNKYVRCYFNIPINFEMTDEQKINSLADMEIPDSLSSEGSKDEYPIFDKVDQEPTFPGGDEARIRFLVENAKYPEKAMESNITGIVYVSFVVEKDGRITAVQVIRGIGGGCDEESVRVIKMMPNWNPAILNGEPVRARFSMPIKFTLSAGATEKNTKKTKGKKSN